VIHAVARAAGHPLNVLELPRRPGDIPQLIARSDRLRRELGWEPCYDDLDVIVQTALSWEYRLASAALPTASVA
jgi:UDP-glucose 4-epimerase